MNLKFRQHINALLQVKPGAQRGKNWALATLSSLILATSGGAAGAESLRDALSRAYQANPQINRQRASLRAADETLPLARSGFLPNVNGRISGTTTNSDGRGSSRASAGIQVDQNLFNGFRTVNSIRQAEAGVRASRAGLANTELGIMRAGAIAYINVLRDQQLVKLQRSNLSFLDEQVRAARARFDVGEGTRTDIASAQAQQAAARAQISSAEATLRISEAQYRQVIGAAPTGLQPVRVPTHLVPASLNAAIEIALARHPAIKAQQYAADSEKFGVRIAEGALLPSLDLTGALTATTTDTAQGSFNDASITATLTIPLFAGGRNYANVRQAKQRLSAERIGVDQTRDEVRLNVQEAWAQLQAARAAVSANRAQLEAGRLALEGVVEERNVGQRTTLDVLASQRTVNDARIGLAQAQANQKAAAFAVAASTGRLTARSMGLGVKYYDETAHYEQVKDKWFGLRTPSGQ
ncbi:MAG: TolC family outer membrane protein [Pseudomonadota bacterium]